VPGIGAKRSEHHGRLLCAGGLGDTSFPEFFERRQADASLGRFDARLLVEVREPFADLAAVGLGTAGAHALGDRLEDRIVVARLADRLACFLHSDQVGLAPGVTDIVTLQAGGSG